ncbi:unnamed protein product [Albugo candida]|uniref:Uncharacterized protein n=1 Tax=Albugo candida TaxID=65357 RepID=A0A024GUY3_9STRA|nr:unnamed protein product [Albugo candida]|eukprot:CCI50189.1 unnamed protein product [Albugo candida]
MTSSFSDNLLYIRKDMVSLNSCFSQQCLMSFSNIRIILVGILELAGYFRRNAIEKDHTSTETKRMCSDESVSPLLKDRYRKSISVGASGNSSHYVDPGLTIPFS